jgi:hypothetical protein
MTPHNGLVLELGTTPTSFDVSNFVGALRLRFESDGAVWYSALIAAQSKIASYAGTHDPVGGQTWGGVVHNRGYFGGRSATTISTSTDSAGSVLDGQRVDTTPSGAETPASQARRFRRRLGRALRRRGRAAGFAANRSHFTIGTAAISALSSSCR